MAAQLKQPKTGGDDLDDGLDLDADLVASGSEGEEDDDDEVQGVGAGAGGDADVEGEGDLPVLEELDAGEGVKRKRADTDDEREGRKEGEGEEEVDEEERKRRKKEKMKMKEKERKAKRNAAEPTTPTVAGTYLPTITFHSLLRTSLLSSNPSLTSMEENDILPPISSLLPPPENFNAKKEAEAEAAGAGVPDSLEPLCKRIRGLLKKNGKVLPGKPRVILLCLSGIRCADVVRGVRDVKGDGAVAKLFAKHMKASEQATYIAKTKVSIAVGTPARVGKLLADGSLQVDKNTVLLLDLTHKDVKTRTLLTLPEIRDELWRSIFAGQARKSLIEGGVRIGAF